MDVLADLESKLNDAKTALAPLVAAETAAIDAAAVATKARVGQDVQIAAIAAAHVAAKARLLGNELVAKVESDVGKGVANVETDAGKVWKWLISHSWVGGLAGVLGYGVRWMGWL